MIRIAFAVLVGWVASAAVAAPVEKKASPQAEPAGKNRAPVTLDVQMKDGVAHVTLSFQAAAQDVNVAVKGVDGMVVTGPLTLVESGRFSAGQTATFDVAYVPGPGRSNLSIAVIGTFNGSRLGTTAMYGVGTPTEEQKRTPGEIATDSNGQRIKVLRAADK